jgi:hypothetical protein
LTIDWNYPVYLSEDGRYTKLPDPPTLYKIMTKEDRRPLLVLREFPTFDDPNNEKLSRKLFTEKTVLLSHWFNCVRLPHHVTETTHPFHPLYQGDDPPQLFLASADGAQVLSFDYLLPRADLKKYMVRILDAHYVKSPSKVVDDLVKMLPRFDKLDRKIQDLKENLDRAIESTGPRSNKARKLMRELKRAEADRSELEAKKKALREIPLKEAKKAAP